jgi:hypothetical protein
MPPQRGGGCLPLGTLAYFDFYLACP